MITTVLILWEERVGWWERYGYPGPAWNIAAVGWVREGGCTAGLDKPTQGASGLRKVVCPKAMGEMRN